MVELDATIYFAVARCAELSAHVLVLDVGCGAGYVSAVCKERGALPHGLDFSKEMVAIAKKMFPQIEFPEGDA